MIHDINFYTPKSSKSCVSAKRSNSVAGLNICSSYNSQILDKFHSMNHMLVCMKIVSDIARIIPLPTRRTAMLDYLTLLETRGL